MLVEVSQRPCFPAWVGQSESVQHSDTHLLPHFFRVSVHVKSQVASLHVAFPFDGAGHASSALQVGQPSICTQVCTPAVAPHFLSPSAQVSEQARAESTASANDTSKLASGAEPIG